MNVTNPYTVLIIDDSDVDRLILARFLEKTELPMIVLEASSGQEGLHLLESPREQLEANYPGISAPITLFLDINMPIMSGWEFLEELEQNLEQFDLKPTIVLMHSTSNTEWEKQKAFGYKPVADYIVKGDYSIEQLKKSIMDCHKAQS